MKPVRGNKAKGRGVKVVELTNRKYQLNEDALKQILLREDVKDLPVMLVSLAGAYRGGKSFMLNFFLRYLTAPEVSRNESGDWLGVDDAKLEGFEWKGGADRHTTGILMWSEPFITTLPSGDKIAVLLMDTQGSFDSTSTLRDCSTVFALSMLVSTIQIYNIKENIKEDDLQHLQLFSQYGKSIATADGTKAFQVLEFLIRDWQYEYDHSYGQAGGEELLAKRLQINQGMPAELSELRQQIRSSFDTVTCFLMPPPGNAVRTKTFAGRLLELDPEFKDALKKLVPSIFAPNKITPKLINGEKVKARDLFTYFKTYMEIFYSSKAPTVDSIMKATSRAALLGAVRDARELYEEQMALLSGAPQSLPPQALEDEHRRALTAAVVAFRDRRTMASREVSDEYLAKMSKEIEERLQEFVLINNGKLERAIKGAKETYEAAILRVHGKDMLCLHPEDLDSVHDDAMTAALTLFDTKRRQFPNVPDVERMNFLKVFDKELETLRNMNERHNQMVVNSARLNFSSSLESSVISEPPLDDDQFAAKYEEAKEEAITELESKRNISSQHENDPYKTSLLKEISAQYITLGAINRSKNRRAIMLALNHFNLYMKEFWDPEQCCLHPDDLKQGYLRAKNQAFKQVHTTEGDVETVLLNEIFESKYYVLDNQNNALNDVAVSKSLQNYNARMEANHVSNWWWIAVVPKVVEKMSKPRQHRDAQKAALDQFFKLRRASNNSEFDPFLTKLNRQIAEDSKKYL